jgi:hypothetical protein
MPAPTQNQLVAIARVLNRFYPEKWAITGSVALVLQAKVSQVSSGIWPGDLDIIIDTDQFDTAVMLLASKLGVELKECPGPRDVHAEIKYEEVGIDLLHPGAERGDLSNITRMKLDGVQVNVVGLSALRARLVMRIDDWGGNKQDQAREDLQVIDKVAEARGY